MTHHEVVKAIVALYPGVEFSYDGDGSTLGPVSDEAGGLQSRGLEWHSDTPPPTLDELAAAAVAQPDTAGSAAAGLPTVDQAGGLAAIAALDPKTATVADVIAAAGGAA